MNHSEIIEKIKTRRDGDLLNLFGANLYEANLFRADLSGANLSWANLSRANLSWANLSTADLSRANLSWANLSTADLSGANLSWADLSTADLSGANLSWANLSTADLSGANLSWANLSNIRIINTIGNGKEIKSAQFDEYNVVWTADTLAIGCQQHPISKWQKADPRWIAAMAADATEWWAKHGEFVLKMIEHSPATGKIIAD